MPKFQEWDKIQLSFAQESSNKKQFCRTHIF